MAAPNVKNAFNKEVVVLPLDLIVPQRPVEAIVRKGTIYKRIAASLDQVGLIEPVVVYPQGPGQYLLLDGHLRIDILRRSHVRDVRAILATDDEAYTYNKRVNHAPPVAQHFMILKALKNGVDERRIAAALNVDVSSIRKKRDMLDGICPEVIELLRNHHVTADAFQTLRKMKPLRQIEAAEHMIASNTFSVRFAKALLAVTRPEMLLDPNSTTRKVDVYAEGAIHALEQETESLLKDLKAVEESYGTDVLTLTVACGYIERLLANARIEAHLSKHHAEILGTLKALLNEIKPARLVRASA